MRTIISVLIIIGLIIAIFSFLTWTGDILGTKAVSLTYHSQNGRYISGNKSYNFTIWFSTVAESMDDFFVYTDMKLMIPDGYIEFHDNTAPINKNFTVAISFSGISIFENNLYTPSIVPIKTHFDGNYMYYFIPPKTMTFQYPLSGKEYVMPELYENGTIINGMKSNYSYYVEIQQAYGKTQINLSKATMILSYWVVYLSIVTAILEYGRIKKKK